MRREKNRREEKEEKIDCVKERACILQTFYHKNMLKNMAYVLDNKLSKYNSTLFTQLHLINEYMYLDLYSRVEMLKYLIVKTNRTEIQI